MRIGTEDGPTPTDDSEVTTVIDGLQFANAVSVGGFEWTGNFTTIELIAASTNALKGALLARRPDHCQQFTIAEPALPPTRVG